MKRYEGNMKKYARIMKKIIIKKYAGILKEI